MSEANVALVVGLQPDADLDVAQLFRDDDLWAALMETVAPFFHPDCETVGTLFGIRRTYIGVEGLRSGLRDWMTPWATYRQNVEEAIDLGDRVLLLMRDSGRREGSTREVKGSDAAVWTVRDGKIARIEFYVHRREALEAVGLGE
jgi:ketosteroid isomerase-like protein